MFRTTLIAALAAATTLPAQLTVDGSITCKENAVIEFSGSGTSTTQQLVSLSVTVISFDSANACSTWLMGSSGGLPAGAVSSAPFAETFSARADHTIRKSGTCTATRHYAVLVSASDGQNQASGRFGCCECSAGQFASGQLFGEGCPGSSGLTPHLALTGTPSLGRAVGVELTGCRTSTLGGIFVGLVAEAPGLPFTLGATTCNVLVAPDSTLAMTTTTAGVAMPFVTIPNDPGLAGLPLFSQGFAFDQGANPFGVVVSNAARFVAGARGPVQVTSIAPLSGVIGTIVTIRGHDFGDDPANLCVRSNDAFGQTVFLKALAIAHIGSEDVLTARVETMADDPQPGPIHVFRGAGSLQVVAPTSNLSAPGELWTWSGQDPAFNMAASTQLFTPIATDGPTVNVPFIVQGNRVTVDLPPDPCVTAFVYPQNTVLTSDAHWDSTCTGSGATRHFDYFLRSVFVVNAAGMLCPQVALEYGGGTVLPFQPGTMSQALDADPNTRGQFAVSRGAGLSCQIFVEHLDPSCTILGGGGNLRIDCP
ncbi:MAG: hypothetical protein KDE27_33205 [Planctomycetes bacterium]|nr:hypothetical protein [Planctomycetota bacterium]